MGEKEIKQSRKTLAEGHTREWNSAHHTGEGWDRVESDGGKVTFDSPVPAEKAAEYLHPAIERDVADQVYGGAME